LKTIQAKKFQCHLCQSSFASREKLKNHVQCVHQITC
jgi:hypothetical protein